MAIGNPPKIEVYWEHPRTHFLGFPKNCFVWWHRNTGTRRPPLLLLDVIPWVVGFLLHHTSTTRDVQRLAIEESACPCAQVSLAVFKVILREKKNINAKHQWHIPSTFIEQISWNAWASRSGSSFLLQIGGASTLGQRWQGTVGKNYL